MDQTLFFLVLAGFCAGLLDSIAGGGGLISLPAILASGMPPHVALGTNKLQSVCGTTAALFNFHRHRKILWKIAAAGVPFALAGSMIGAKIALVVPSSVLAKILVVAIPPAALVLFASKKLLHPAGAHRTHGIAFWAPTISACLFVGMYDGFFGPGTGTILIIALVLASRMPMLNASATAKVFNVASNVGALATFIYSGHIDYTIGLAMAAANIAGAYFGSHYAVKHGDQIIRGVLFLAIALLFAYLFWTNCF